ncbi:autotransporter-associated beta strand repeat-containing protein [Luteolibacter sp. LG18]|uniref:beta strand repeat-containing protein n=1 Tax=Luteolibacter sp. LG18 TaxID=2819286 RepID=UPI002B2DF21C|nr:hypothetical protein llg_36230 [Luteolibacter sp. LG18]
MKPRRFLLPLIVSLSVTGIAAAASFTWSSGVNADWNTNNWGGGFPNTPGDVAQYTSTTTNATTALPTNVTVGQLQGNDPGKLWIINPAGGALTLDNTGGTANVFTNNNAAISSTGAAADGETIRVVAAVNLANTDLDVGTTNGGMTVSGPITASANQTLTFRNNSSVASRHIVVSGSIGLTGTGNIALVNSSTRATDAPSGANPSGVLLSGILGTRVTGITHNSPGGLFLTGVNSFTGAVSIASASTSGLLGIATDSALGASTNTVTLNNGILSNILINSTSSAFSGGTNLDLPASRSITLGSNGGGIRNAFSKVITINGVIDGTGKLDRTDGGTVVLNGLNTYTGVTTLLAGTTRVSALNNGGTPGNLGAASNAAANLVFGAASTLQYTGTTASTDRGFTLATGVAGTFDILRSETNLTLSGGIPAGTGALNKNGGGTLTLSGASAYTGTTTVNLGTLALTGTLTSNLLIGGATLTGTGTTTGTITFNNVAGAGILASTTGNNAVQGSNLVLNGTTDIYTSQLGDFTTATGSGPVKVLRYTGTQSGAGAFIAQTNFRSGLLTNSAGLVSLEYKAEAKAWSATTGGVWDVNTTTPWTGTADSLFFWGDSVAFGDTAVDQTVTLTGNLAPSAITVSNSANTYTFSGTGGIRGATSLVKSGAGTLALNNTASTFTGGVIISSGTVTTTVASGAAFGNGSITLGDANTLANATSLLYTGTATGQSMAKSIVVSSLGTGTVTIGSGPTAGDSLTYNGIFLNRATTLRNGATASNRVNFRGLTGNVGTLTIAAPTTAGNRVVFELADNTFTGDLVIASAATLQLGAAGAVADTIPDASNVTVNGTLNLSFSSVGETINALSGSGAIGTNSSTNNTLTIGSANGGGNFSGQLTQGGTGSPALAIRKVGTGNQTFSGTGAANNYSGGTTVDGGTLTLSKNAGFGNSTGAVGNGTLTINPGATVTTTVPFAIDGRATASTRVVNVNGGTLNLSGSEYVQTWNLTGGTINAPTNTNDYLRASSGGLVINALASPVTSKINNRMDLTFANLTVDTANGAAAVDLEFTGLLAQNSGAGSGARTLTKTGTGTLKISGSYSYTGDTTVNAGTLSLTTATLSNTANVNLGSAAVLDLPHGAEDTVNQLYINGVLQIAGTWGATGSGATHIDDAHFTGTGRIKATTGATGYQAWAFDKGLTAGNNATSADPDGDGLNNLGEFAFNEGPLSGSTGGRIVTRIATVNTVPALTITLPVRNGATFSGGTELVSGTVDGAIYHIQGSLDLATWDLVVSEVPAGDLPGVQLNIDPPETGWTNRSFYLRDVEPPFPARAFIRAKVSEP